MYRLFLLLALIVSSSAFGRIWENNKGQSIDAELVEFISDSQIKIKLASNGRYYDYNISDLSEADQTYLAEIKTKVQAEQRAAKLAKRKARWTEDLDDALAESKEYDLPILYLFTGSDWCGYCIRLHDQVLTEREFEKYADKNLVLLLLDFPQNKQKRSIAEQNKKLKSEFGVRGYPTVWIVGADGEKLGKIGGYSNWSPEEYVAKIEKILE